MQAIGGNTRWLSQTSSRRGGCGTRGGAQTRKQKERRGFRVRTGAGGTLPQAGPQVRTMTKKRAESVRSARLGALGGWATHCRLERLEKAVLLARFQTFLRGEWAPLLDEALSQPLMQSHHFREPDAEVRARRATHLAHLGELSPGKTRSKHFPIMLSGAPPEPYTLLTPILLHGILLCRSCLTVLHLRLTPISTPILLYGIPLCRSCLTALHFLILLANLRRGRK